EERSWRSVGGPDRLAAAAAAACLLLTTAQVAFGQPAPTGAHPRIWLDADTLGNLKRQRAQAPTAAARPIARCADTPPHPSSYRTEDGQGFGWSQIMTTCALAYQIGGNPADAQTALTYLTALLDDYTTLGDGAGGDLVVRHDAGYNMRTFAPYGAVGYDWLHDAPGMTEALRAHARARFAAWTDYYATMGYLRDLPDSNYQAGWLFGATLIAIAEGGEAGATGDALWRLVVDKIFGMDMASGLVPGGALAGGDWAEGWQYGPLSVIEYALAARALEQNGVALPEMDRWAGQLVFRHVYAEVPARTGIYVGGDVDNCEAWIHPNARTLLAVIAGPAGAAARSWAR